MNPFYWLYRFKYNYSQHLNLKVPVDVSLELASVCNQACSYCYHADQKNLPFEKGMMTFELAKRLVYQCADLGVNSIKYNYRGESTLHPEFEAITWFGKTLASGSTLIDRITNSNFKFNTGRDDIFRGLSNQTKVKVSLDSFIPGVMHKQRAGSDLETCLRNINKFYNWPKRKTEIVIQAVRTQLNKDEDIRGQVKRLWPEASCNINDMVSGRINKNLDKIEVKLRDFNNRKSCIQAHSRLMINFDGMVQACCPDIGSKLIIGNANTMSIEEIWNGEPAKRLRQSLLNKTAFEKDPCKTCPSHESYSDYKGKWRS